MSELGTTMHPNRRFAWDDRDAMLAFVNKRGFAHLFGPTPDGPRVAHAPLVVTAEGNVRFHLARANPLTAHLDGAAVVASVAGADAYISPDWYGTPDQVPTWNYVTVEIEGVARRLDEAGLIEQADALSAVQEAALPKTPWTRHKMTPGRFEAMLPAIVGFEIDVTALRGTRKLGQNKRPDEIDGMLEGLRNSGQDEIATLVEAARR